MRLGARENTWCRIELGLTILVRRGKGAIQKPGAEILGKLQSVKPQISAENGPSNVIPDPDLVSNRGIQEPERDIIFSNDAVARGQWDWALTHNDLTQSNCIVNNGKIVAVVDWEMAGLL